MAYSFEENDVRTKLLSMSKRSRVIFAAACATRLLPQYEEYEKKIKPNEIGENPIIKGLYRLWDNLTTGRNGLRDIDELIVSCETALPDEEDACDVDSPYAADAAAAVYYALSAYKSDSVQNALWSARRVYEALDNHVVNKFDIDPSSLAGEKKVLEHPLVQKELLRQNRDIQELISVDDTNIQEVAKRLRTRALSEAGGVFS